MTIYFVQETNNPEGLVKIGYSEEIEVRLSAMQSNSPAPLSLLFTLPGDTKLEAFFHNHFATLNAYGEWFRSEGDLKTFVNLFTDSKEIPLPKKPRFVDTGEQATVFSGIIQTKTKDVALTILRDNPAISGAELGRELGKSESLGRKLKRELTPIITADGNGAGKG